MATAQSDALAQLQDFAGILKPKEPLAPYTLLKIGGPAEVLAQPCSLPELASLVRRCHERQIPLRVLGGGCNILVSDEGVRGVVLHLVGPAFSEINVQGRRVRAGCSVSLAALISHAARHNLAGLESLVGTPGTVGGALRHNAGDRSGEIGPFVRLVEVLDSQGAVQVRERDELRFGYHQSNLDDPVLLAGEFDLEPDRPEAIVKRLRKAWIQRKSSQPFSFQATGRMFKNPRGLSAE